MVARFTLRGVCAAVAASALLTACGGWFGEDEPPPLPGERRPVLGFASALEPDPRLAGAPLDLPEASVNAEWPQAGGGAEHDPGNLKAGLSQAWRVNLGAGDGDGRRLLSQPVVAAGAVYAVDAAGQLAAVDAGSGRLRWRVDLTPRSEDGAPLGGGAAFADGRIYATNGFRDVVALDAASGAEIWRARTPSPARGAPTLSNGRVFVVTVDNQTIALGAADGVVLWTHRGIGENAGILGAPSPATKAGLVLSPYSSGELYALRAESGRVAWSDSLTSSRRGDAVSAISDIRGLPAIDGDLVVAIGNGGRMAAIDLRSGNRAWEQPIGGVNMPLVVGEGVFVVTNARQLVALDRRTGLTRWVVDLPRESFEDRNDPILWTGPIMANGELALVSDRGELATFAPQDGRRIATRQLPHGASVSPVIANGTLYVLSDDGSLTAWR